MPFSPAVIHMRVAPYRLLNALLFCPIRLPFVITRRRPSTHVRTCPLHLPESVPATGAGRAAAAKPAPLPPPNSEEVRRALEFVRSQQAAAKQSKSKNTKKKKKRHKHKSHKHKRQKAVA